MFSIRGYYDEVVKVEGQRIAFKEGANHGVSTYLGNVVVGDKIMIDSYGRLWKMEKL